MQNINPGHTLDLYMSTELSLKGLIPLRGLEKVCKSHGSIKLGDVVMAWDYARNHAVPKEHLHRDRERWALSERAKWQSLISNKV